MVAVVVAVDDKHFSSSRRILLATLIDGLVGELLLVAHVEFTEQGGAVV